MTVTNYIFTLPLVIYSWIDIHASPLRRLLRRPGEVMQAFSEALDQTARNANPKYLGEEEEVLLGFEGSFGFHRLTPRELLSPFLSALVSVEGIVTKCKQRNSSLENAPAEPSYMCGANFGQS